MKLKSYKITEIDEDRQTISFTMTFDDATTKESTISCKDGTGNIVFDISDEDTLKGQIQGYAAAYIIGKELEKSVKLEASSDVEDLVGDVITVK